MMAAAPRPGRVVCFGEVLLRLSAPGGELLLQSPTLSACVGGAEANVAVSCYKHGVSGDANPATESQIDAVRQGALDVRR